MVKLVLSCGKVSGLRQPGSLIDDLFGCGHSPPVETGYAVGESVDERVQFRIRYRAIDSTVTLRRIGIEVIGAYYNFHGASPANQ